VARSINLVLASIAMLAAALLAHAMAPHRLMARMHDAFDIDAHVPHAFGDWSALPGLEAVRPRRDGREARIANQEVSRAFVDKEGHAIMLVIAYSENQGARLQLHHPEICYTAQGFRVTRPVTSTFAWSPSAPSIELTRLIATREARFEPISYWIRIGYDVTNSNFERQLLKVEYGLRGWIPDRLLFRVSTVGMPAEMSFKIQEKFIRDLLNAAPAETRAFLVGDPAKALLPSRRQAAGQGEGQSAAM
jgi:EpsI family protein